MMGHLNGFLAWEGEIGTIIFKKVKCPGNYPGGCGKFDLTDTLQCGQVFLNPIWVP